MITCFWKFWKFCLNLNRTRLHKIRRLRQRNNYMSFYLKNLSFISSIFSFYFFASNRNLTIHGKTQLMSQLQFMLKSQQKVDCQKYVKAGAHYLEPATPIISQCSGIFTDQSIFRNFPREKGQFQSTLARFGEDQTMRPHLNMSTCLH